MPHRPLTDRIADAERELSAVDATRRQSNAELDRILSAVEDRFSARTIERDHVRAKLAPLAEANRTLAALVDRLATCVEDAAAADQTTLARLADELTGPVSPGWRFEDVSAEELGREESRAV